MLARTLLCFSAIALMAAAAVSSPAAGRSLTDAETWAVTGGKVPVSWCCGVAPKCENKN